MITSMSGGGQVEAIATAAMLVANLLASSASWSTGATRDSPDNPRSRIVMRVQSVFGSDAQSTDALEDACQDGSATAVDDLASALEWYARRDQSFASDLITWAGRVDGGALPGVPRDCTARPGGQRCGWTR